MGTKNRPGLFDCYDAALPDEPSFHLLARDPDFRAASARSWANKRERDIKCGERPLSDMARNCPGGTRLRLCRCDLAVGR